MKVKIKVAAYYRMSSDDQKASISQQRKEVRAYAAERGYEIVREYIEEGKSGSKDQEKRVEFERMLVDAAKREFTAVLCWNTSRFARLDSLDGSLAKQVLRNNGVHLETVKEGKIDWNTFEGRILDVLFAESDHKFSRDISSLTLRGRLDTLKRGYWPNGSVPYGFDRLYIDGEKTHHVQRQDDFRKPRNWKLKLTENAGEAEIVRWLFDQFSKRDTSFRQLAMELSERGVASPGAGRGGWTKDSVKQVLSNRAYIGIGQIGHGRRRAKEVFNRAEPTEQEGCCPKIIEQATFDMVQAKLVKKRAAGRKPHGNRSSPLTGCLYCGHCGYSLDKKSHKGRTYFTCS
ncbi:MAG: recombinase family protein, partial [Planctomycetes bacterium]|nr:recombinase family protein [Planctomycetota bacterium]